MAILDSNKIFVCIVEGISLSVEAHYQLSSFSIDIFVTFRWTAMLSPTRKKVCC